MFVRCPCKTHHHTVRLTSSPFTFVETTITNLYISKLQDRVIWKYFPRPSLLLPPSWAGSPELSHNSHPWQLYRAYSRYTPLPAPPIPASWPIILRIVCTSQQIFISKVSFSVEPGTDKQIKGSLTHEDITGQWQSFITAQQAQIMVMVEQLFSLRLDLDGICQRLLEPPPS